MPQSLARLRIAHLTIGLMAALLTIVLGCGAGNDPTRATDTDSDSSNTGTSAAGTIKTPPPRGPEIPLYYEQPLAGGVTPKAVRINQADLPTVDSSGWVLSAAEFWPPGTELPLGAEVSWPLLNYQQPGSRLYILELNASGKSWQWTGEMAKVSEDGKHAVGTVWHFSKLGVALWNPQSERDAVLFEVHHNGVRSQRIADAKVMIRASGQTKIIHQGGTDHRGNLRVPILEGSRGEFSVLVTHPDYKPAQAVFTKLANESASLRIEMLPLKDSETRPVALKFKSPTDTYTFRFNEPVHDLNEAMKAEVWEKEAEFYLPEKGYKWELVPNMTEVRSPYSRMPPYVVKSNVPTVTQLCGGLALSPLMGGPYNFSTNETLILVKRFGTPISIDLLRPTYEQLRPGDIVAFEANEQVTHFAFVEKVFEGVKARPTILTKDITGLVWRGYLDQFPRADYGKPTYYYRIPWDDIDVTREGDPEPATGKYEPRFCLRNSMGGSEQGQKVRNALFAAADELSERYFGKNKYLTNGGAAGVGQGANFRTIDQYEFYWNELRDRADRGKSFQTQWSWKVLDYHNVGLAKSQWEAGGPFDKIPRTSLFEAERGGQKVLRFDLERQPAPDFKSDPVSGALPWEIQNVYFWREGPLVIQVKVVSQLAPSPAREVQLEAFRNGEDTALAMLLAIERQLQRAQLSRPLRPVGFPGRRESPD